MNISDEDISGFIDGALDPARAAAVAASAAADPAVAARIAAFEQDRARLLAAFGPIGAQPVPQAWIDRIEAATASGEIVRPAFGARRTRLQPRIWMALAACLAVAVAGVAYRGGHGPADTILAEADAARHGTLAASAILAGAALPDAATQDSLLKRATGLAVRVPDLRRQGFALAELDIYAHAAALRYRDGGGRPLTLYVRASAGPPRFDLLKDGAVRTCIWQDEVVGAVMIGEMSAGQMMRVASAAYTALNL